MFGRQSRPHRGARSPRWIHSPWFGFFPTTIPLLPLPRPALWSVSRQSLNRSSILHTSGSGKRQRSPRGGLIAGVGPFHSVTAALVEHLGLTSHHLACHYHGSGLRP